MHLSVFSPHLLLIGTKTGLHSLRTCFLAHAPDIEIETIEVALPYDSARLRADIMRAVRLRAPLGLVLASPLVSADLAERLRTDLPMPIWGVGVGLAHAARLSCTRHTAIVGLPALFEQPSFIRAADLYAANGLKIKHISASSLVYPAERKLERNILPDLEALRAFVAPIRADQRIDTIILADVHAHYLRSLIEGVAFKPYYWVDAIDIAAMQIADALRDMRINTA